jgi:hypothetical protein
VLEQYEQMVDSCDVIAERLLVQPDGAIGVLALSRSMFAVDAEAAFGAFFQALYEESAFTLGETLVMQKILRVASSPDLHWLRGLMLFGDPAVNLRWRDLAHDSIDVAIGTSGIGGGVADRYLDASGDELRLTIRNQGPVAGTDFELDVWRGHPDSLGSELVGSGTVSVAAYDTVIVTVTTGTLDVGPADLFVLLDPDTLIAEPTRGNNIAHRRFYVLPYISGFPIRHPDRAQRSVVMADLTSGTGSEVLVATKQKVLCYGASGDLLWSFSRSASIYRTGPLVANVYKDGVQCVICEF